MSPNLKICAFFSVSQNFPAILQRLRAKHPNADIAAVIPPNYEASQAERDHASRIIVTEQAEYGPAHIRACLRLIRSLRKERFDRFVVVFDSPQLRILAALTGARKCECWDPDSQIIPLHRHLSAELAAVVLRKACGIAAALALYATVYLAPTRK